MEDKKWKESKEKARAAFKLTYGDITTEQMAEKAASSVGFAGGTTSKVMSIPRNEIGNIAKRMMGEGLKKASRNVHLESAVAKVSQAKKEGGKALERIVNQLKSGKGK